MYLQYITGGDATGHRRKITEGKGAIERLSVLLIVNIIFWIIYYFGIKALRRSIKSKLIGDPAFAERFKNDTMTKCEEYLFTLLGFIILTKRFVIVADLMILMSMFFIFGPH